MSVTAPEGFAASGIACGIKGEGKRDLALVAAITGPVSTAATFTTNRAAAAPVQLSRQHLAATGGRIAAVVLNSGGANAAMGERGMRDAHQTCVCLAQELGVKPEEILVCSTGLIGIPLPVEKIVAGLPQLVGELAQDRQAGTRAAEAILTTDTHDKRILVEGSGFRVGGMAKGAGMIGPNMATMLAVLTTDAAVSPEVAQRVLRQAVGDSFNSLIVDGCTSTNDTVSLLASGAKGPVDEESLLGAVREACQGLAMALADDAEGATKVATINVAGARSDEDARRAARNVASSLLVKTSLYGADPYWGRIVSESGASGADVELDRLSLSYGETLVFHHGEEVPHDREALVRYLSAKVVAINCDLGLGSGSAVILTTDIGHGYIEENMRTS